MSEAKIAPIPDLGTRTDEITIFAGPCSVESAEQFEEVAECVAGLGLTWIRGGAFKPRTNPHSFQGLGEEALKIMRDSGEKHGLKTLTEVMDSAHCELVHSYVDGLQVGARNFQNFSLLKKIGLRSEMLDLFLEFIQDEEHSILLSSHITSDLEKVADYITFIHAGKIVFSKTKDDILEQYGVVKCEKARAAALDGAHILGRRDSKFDAELLVDNRPEVARLYPGILTEQATIDDIMTFFAKGAYDA